MSIEDMTMDELRAEWKKRHECIKNEGNKRVYALVVQGIVCIIAIVLSFLQMIDLLVFICVILCAMFFSLSVNLIVHGRIRRIIWAGFT